MKLEITASYLSLVQFSHKVHATRFESAMPGAVTLCSRSLASATYLAERVVEHELFCNTCFSQITHIGRSYKIIREGQKI